jgi:pyrroline-5-carboxylate reductase
MTRNPVKSDPTAVFLGGGRITSAILAGLELAGNRQRVVVHDHNEGKLKLLRRLHAVNVEPNLEQAVAQAGLLVIAVRPDSVPFLLREVKAAIPLRSRREAIAPRLAISLAAGIPLARLRQMLGPYVLWARAMPSPVCRTGNGLTALTFERGFPVRRRNQVRNLFLQMGAVLDLPERKFDAFTVTYSSSHGYHALAALADAGRQCGLDEKTALMAASHALADGINSWRRQNIPLNRLLHEAATPGGIAEATMTAMDRNGYREAVQRGLRAGLARARTIARR